MTNKPLLNVVAGRPGSGKTTLAHRLAQSMHCPALCRDEFKEGYLRTLGKSHAEVGPAANRSVYEAFFETVNLVIDRQISVVIEAAFRHAVWEPRLIELASRADLGIIVCTMDPTVARARAEQRDQKDAAHVWFHGGQPPPADDAYRPPELPVPTLAVDTTDGYSPSLEEIVAFAMRRTTDAT